MARQRPSHGGTKRRNAEWFVDGGNVGGKFAYPTTPGHIIHAEDGEIRKVLPHPRDELGAAKPRHVVIGDDEIESRREAWPDFGQSLFCAGCARNHRGLTQNLNKNVGTLAQLLLTYTIRLTL